MNEDIDFEEVFNANSFRTGLASAQHEAFPSNQPLFALPSQS